jgi:hypothetical protein
VRFHFTKLGKKSGSNDVGMVLALGERGKRDTSSQTTPWFTRSMRRS